jgi:CRISPR-associated protein Csd2
MNRYDFLYLFDCANANPNGDPDAGNLPRVDPETNHGIVTDVCLKRKLRNFILLTKKDESPYRIYVKEKAVLSTSRKPAMEQTTETPRTWMCRNFWDVRTFGAVMATKENNCGQVRGPVQLSFAQSVDPVIISEYALTRCAVETEKEAKDQSGDNRTMGRKFTVPYGLYLAHGFINPFLAEQTHFSDEDREVLFVALENAFQFDQSAARPAGAMNARALLVFEHASQLGSAPSHKIFETVKVSKKPAIDVARSFVDYEIHIYKDELPKGINLHARL